MIKFICDTSDIKDCSSSKLELTIGDHDITLDDMLSHVETFLTGIGYHVPRGSLIVEETVIEKVSARRRG